MPGANGRDAKVRIHVALGLARLPCLDEQIIDELMLVRQPSSATRSTMTARPCQVCAFAINLFQCGLLLVMEQIFASSINWLESLESSVL